MPDQHPPKKIDEPEVVMQLLQPPPPDMLFVVIFSTGNSVLKHGEVYTFQELCNMSDNSGDNSGTSVDSPEFE